jgi:hypothetical protein
MFAPGMGSGIGAFGRRRPARDEGKTHGHLRNIACPPIVRAGSGPTQRGSRVHSARARAECLEQLPEAFRDIIDRDDIHQAARRLLLVQE